MEFKHVSVMLEECLDGLNLKDDGIYVDGTIGGAGHSKEILKRTRNAKLIGIDRDTEALNESKNKLAPYLSRVTLVHDNFKNIKQILENLNVDKIDGMLVDLGVSSYQLDNADRGFSFRFDAKLDMRMNQEQKLSAYDVVNNYSQTQLKQIISDYGEEKFASSIARHIVEARTIEKIETTGKLKEIILKSVPRYKGNDGSSNVQRTFQAIRIEVNKELTGLDEFIRDAVDALKVGGRLAILTFHSLEDRIVKHTFRDLCTACICPPDFPICVCNHKAIGKLVGKMQVASKQEIKQNSRSTSAKLRVIEKI